MVLCCVNGCFNRSHNTRNNERSSAAFYRFPWYSGDDDRLRALAAERYKQWVCKVKRSVTDGTRICSEHFVSGMYE
jgi:THAP domain